MAKPLRDITKHGVNSSKEVPNDLTNLAMSPEGNKGEIEFAKKHKIQRKDDVAGNGDEIYNGSNVKTAPYKKQDQKVYESSECNNSGEGVSCPTHEMAACPGSEPKDSPKKGQKVLLDKKKVSEEVVDEGIRAMKRKDTAYKDNPRRLSNEYPKSFKQPGTPSKSDLRSIVSKAIEDKPITKLPAGKAKGIKEEILDEVAPPNPKIEKWIKANKERFVKEYGKEKGTQVLYAKAWKMHGQSESGAATETDYAGPGAAGWSTGRHDVGTL